MIICYTLLIFTYYALGGECDEWLVSSSTMSLHILYNIHNNYSRIVTDHYLHYWEYILIPTAWSAYNNMLHSPYSDFRVH